MTHGPTGKLMPVSFSRLSTFENCEQQFDYLYVSKSVKSQDTDATLYGTRVHEVLEHHGRGLKGDPASQAIVALEGFKEAEQWLPLVERINAAPGEKYYEHEMAIRKDKSPCTWQDPDVWIRGIADVLVVDNDRAWCLDWKTGKVKANPTQLALFAALVMHSFPAVNEVKTSFIWLKFNETTDAVYSRSKLGHLWLGLEPRFERLQEAVDLGVFKARPSGLCKWCSARSICSSAR